MSLEGMCCIIIGLLFGVIIAMYLVLASDYDGD